MPYSEAVEYIVSLLVFLLCWAVLSRVWPRRPDRQANAPPKDAPAPKRKALSGTAVRQHIAGFPDAKVIEIIDGDTVDVAKQDRRVRIRLDSIDCPEDGQDWGDTAKYGLIKLIGGRNVRLEEHGLDIHGRTLATIYVQHPNADEYLNVNERMVTLGHAWVSNKYYDHLPHDRQVKLNQLEVWARSKKIGLWRAANPIPPWRWRNQERDNKRPPAP